MIQTEFYDDFEVTWRLSSDKLAFVVHADSTRFKILYRNKFDHSYEANAKNKLNSAIMVAQTEMLLLFIKDKVDLKEKGEWCLVGRNNEALVAAIETYLNLKTRRLSEDEALQRTIKFYNLSSSTPSLENVIKGTKIEKNAIFGMDNLKEYLLSKPPPNFFVDLSKIPIEDWRHKYMLASGKMKVPCLLLSLSDVSVLYHVDEYYQVRIVEHLSFSVQSIQAIAQQMLPKTDFTNFLDLASIGDIDKVTIRWKDVTMQNEGYYSYPDSIYVFELGKITSNNFGHEEKGYSEADLASGTLRFLTHTLTKSVLAYARALNVEQIYACGDIFLNPHFKESFQKLSLYLSLSFFVQKNKLLKTHVLEAPCYLTALGAWL